MKQRALESPDEKAVTMCPFWFEHEETSMDRVHQELQELLELGFGSTDSGRHLTGATEKHGGDGRRCQVDFPQIRVVSCYYTGTRWEEKNW